MQAPGEVDGSEGHSLLSKAGPQVLSVTELPFQRQQDKFVLDHRIHQPAPAVPGPAAVAVAGLPQATAAGPGPLAHSAQSGSAPIDIKGRGVLQGDPPTPELTFCAQQRQTRQQQQSQQQQQQSQQQQQLGQGVETMAAMLQQGSSAGAQALSGVEGGSSLFAGSEPPNVRKGMVLLDMATHTRTTWEFEAIIVLLNGHWPARGLLSGRWPPNPQTPDTVLSSSLPETPFGGLHSKCLPCTLLMSGGWFVLRPPPKFCKQLALLSGNKECDSTMLLGVRCKY